MTVVFTFVFFIGVAATLYLRRRAARVPASEIPLEGVVPVPGEPARGPPLPVVLVHGLFGFDRIGAIHYFRGIARHLDSLGGLDARYALSKLGLASRVRTLVTSGTPHHGTPLSAIGEAGALSAVRKLLRLFGIRAFDWLSPSALERFNAEVPDAPGVRYACVVGGIRSDSTGGPLALSPVQHYLRRTAGANNGRVPIASQVGGEVLAEIEADHFAQVGWRFTARSSFDATALYAWVVARVGDVAAVAAAS